MDKMDIKMPNISEIQKLDVEELARSTNKSLNAFFLYRKEFTKRAIASGMKIKMTELSKKAGNSWKNESKKVKKAYAEVSKRVDDLLQKRRQEKKTYEIIYDTNMEKVPQEPEPIDNQVPLQSFPPEETILSLSVDDITYLCSIGINANIALTPHQFYLSN
ncbi:MATA-HMG [Gigaspora margarita]|uniref:MATA-HMG n=1 Tax=Gigaspora margarita TaxID=4874 RepID=A0A8H3ZZ76_GIGMA|nr:MATA-HMG [Gigaspora margarita]